MKGDYFTREHNEIDPTAIIEPGAIIGKGNIIGPYTLIRSCVTLGDNNYIGPHVVIGEPAEYREHPPGKTDTRIVIGNRNRISEFVAVQSGILTEATEIGDECYIMHGCHIAHDNKIGDGVTIAPLVCVGGSVEINDFANIGMGVTIHPRLIIGIGAMVGMNATVTKDVPEWETWIGTPARFKSMNERGMKKHGIESIGHHPL